MIYVLIAIVLRFNANGDMESAKTFTPFADQVQCARIRDRLYVELSKEQPESKLLFACVPMERPVKS
jgi:hypothetical protein